MFYDKKPVSLGHLLIIPKVHRINFFQLSPQERKNMSELLLEAKKVLDFQYSPQGYNIGLNCGGVAGQTIFHCHLIPR